MKYYIYIQHLINNNTLDLYACLTQLNQVLKIEENITLPLPILSMSIISLYYNVSLLKMDLVTLPYKVVQHGTFKHLCILEHFTF